MLYALTSTSKSPMELDKICYERKLVPTRPSVLNLHPGIIPPYTGTHGNGKQKIH